LRLDFRRWVVNRLCDVNNCIERERELMVHGEVQEIAPVPFGGDRRKVDFHVAVVLWWRGRRRGGGGGGLHD
jgi:hypothetical protein